MQADLVGFSYSENFDGTPVGDLLPAGWVEANGDFDISLEAKHGNTNAAKLVGSASGIEVATYNGLSTDPGMSPAANWLNYGFSASLGTDTWSESTSIWWGMLARVQDDGSAYGFRITSNGVTNTVIQLIRVTSTGGIATLGTSSSTSTIDSGETVDIEFSVSNDDINSEVDLAVTMVTNNGVTKSLSRSVDYSNSTVIATPGPLGFVANSANRGPSWDDIVVNGLAVPVPEPSALALALLGLAGVAGRRG
ncbi:PEP-CTERM sorting domain-containing protein [Mucisphaera calidilacus]|uniref:PEP-CTERM sorting domain-containing protein n=1 Tax=Mucisphaera calidilacus TaxID=2527982 RepID=UPI001F3BB828|nr:PEP-CTERM sorting domain-containing protein [Mucisphaera calidilacus]